MDNSIDGWKALGCLLCIASAIVMIFLLTGLGYAVLVWLAT